MMNQAQVEAQVDKQRRLCKEYLRGYYRECAAGLSKVSVEEKVGCGSDTVEQMEMFWEASRVAIPQVHTLYSSMIAGLRQARHEAIDQESKRRLQEIEGTLPEFQFCLMGAMLSVMEFRDDLRLSGEDRLQPGALAEVKNSVDSALARAAVKPRDDRRKGRRR